MPQLPIATMIKTKRWCDPIEPDDGFRVLVARYRPRGGPAGEETWEAFVQKLGPSKAVQAAYYGKIVEPITWSEYAQRYLDEMRAQGFFIRGLAEHVRSGRPLTLLCSSACRDENLCHRT